MRVLTLSNMPAARAVIRCVLDRVGGVDVCEFDDPRLAAAATKTTIIDCAIIDCPAREEDGITFVRQLRKRECHRDIPTIFFSSDSSPARHEALARDGVTDAMARPIVPWLLYSRCARLLRSQAVVAEAKARVRTLEVQLTWALAALDDREHELVMRGY